MTVDVIITAEKFKAIKGYERYLISNLGRVYSIRSKRFMIVHIDSHGYGTVPLSKKGFKVKRAKVHILVAESFILNALNLATVNHIDEDKTNNNVDNLEWMTYEENARLGNIIPIIQMNLQGIVIRCFECAKDVKKIFDIDEGNIAKVCKGKRISAGGFKWAYADVGGEGLSL